MAIVRIQRIILSFFWVLSACAILIGGPVMAIEEPEYALERKTDRFEVRQYRPLIVAETFVDGDLDDASNAGFRRIAAYIFGDNQSARGVDGQAAGSAKETIAMTAPVTVEPQSLVASKAMDANRWRIHFVMPKQYSMASLPRPNNPLVILREVPSKRYAVLPFSGFAGGDKSQTLTEELIAWVKSQGLTPVAAPQMARYDPPWRLPFFRRNEILLEIATP
jgi:hypothetical protein